jgi:two-component system chemotaxis response regulator CheB
MIVIGASMGGMKALRAILGVLPADFPIPIALVLHRQRDAGDRLIEVLGAGLALPVREVHDKAPAETGCVHVCPADYHLLVDHGGFSLSTDDPVLYARPSIDVLFESAAEVHRSQVVGIVLTGGNRDGARGALEIRRRGGTVIVQDPKTAECAVMPEAALDMVPDALVRPVEKIGPLLRKLAAANPSF